MHKNIYIAYTFAGYTQVVYICFLIFIYLLTVVTFHFDLLRYSLRGYDASKYYWRYLSIKMSEVYKITVD